MRCALLDAILEPRRAHRCAHASPSTSGMTPSTQPTGPYPLKTAPGSPTAPNHRPRAHAQERLLTDACKHARKRRCRRLSGRLSAQPMAPAAALGSTRTLRVRPRPPTPHPSTSRAPVHPKQAKTRVRTNACKMISAQSRGFEAAGGGLRTFRSRRSVPSEPPRCWPVRPSTPGVGDAKSGRIASMQNMLAARPTVGRIVTCSNSELGGAMAKMACARVRG